MRIDNTGNLPHPRSKKNNKPWETFRPHKCNLHLTGITQFPACYAFCLITGKSLALSMLSLEAVVGSSKVSPFPSLWRPNKCSSCRPSPTITCFNPLILVALFGLSLCLLLGRLTPGAISQTQRSSHKCQTECPWLHSHHCSPVCKVLSSSVKVTKNEGNLCCSSSPDYKPSIHYFGCSNIGKQNSCSVSKSQFFYSRDYSWMT